MTIGNYRASKSITLDVLDNVGKKEHGVDPSVITDKKDAMCYNRVEKLCRKEIYELFSEPSQKGTRICLKLVTYINDSLTSPHLEPEERIRKLS